MLTLRCLLFSLMVHHGIVHPAFALEWGQLEKNIKSTIESLNLGRHSVETEWDDGVLNVTGYVGSGEDKERVGDALGALEGVKSVNNLLEVRVDLYSSSPASSDLRKAVLSAIKSVNGLGLYEVSIHANNDTVSLFGTASSESDRSRIESAAKTVPGVKEVENKLTVLKGPSDADLERDILAALTREKDLDSTGVSIKVKDGIVTLGGQKNNHRTVDRILSIANMVDGVKEVRSEFRIAPSS